MAARGTGEPPVNAARTQVVLYVAAVVLASACVVGGVLAYRHHHQEQQVLANPDLYPPSSAERDRYGTVMEAADATAVAMTNIDYRDPQKSYDAVAATATGDFLKQYKASYDSLVKLVTQYKSVLSGTVATTAVSSIDPDSATVLVATEGTASNAQTGQKRVGRNFRLVLDLTLVDGVWKTSNLDFAG